jgi:hypothetical protein
MLLPQQCQLLNTRWLTMTMEKREMSKTNPDFDLSLQIVLAVKDIRFGSVEITIHDGNVVQIERKEKLRFDKKPILARDSK